jgi:large subunit ribosomal protein L4
MKLPVLNAEGKELRSLEVDDTVFGIQPNEAVLHQAFVTQRNNQRAGTAQTKTRAMVQGSTRKVRMQKYTGRARHGSARAPIFVGGGIVFGPQTRDFGISINKKMRRLAIRSALSGKVADGQLIVIDELTLKTPKTKEVIRVLRNVGIERSALIVTGQPDRAVLASARNLQKTKVLPAAYLNVADMMNHRHLLMTEEAVKVAEGLWGQKQAARAPVAAVPKGRRAKAEAPADVEAKVEEAAEVAPPKPRARRATAAAPEAPTEEKPRARTRTPKPAAEKATPAGEKPARPARRAKAEAKEAEHTENKPRTRSRKPKAPE